MKNLCFILLLATFFASKMPFIESLTMPSSLSLGVDLGTSGVRTCLVDPFSNNNIVHENSRKWSNHQESSDPQAWLYGVMNLIQEIPLEKRRLIQRICISGTSSTAVIFDYNQRRCSRPTRMYNFNVLEDVKVREFGQKAMESILHRCPKDSVVASPSSTLAKLLTWHIECPISDNECLLHQADYVMNNLVSNGLHKKAYSDWHNALKLGFDVHSLQYSDWLTALLEEYNLQIDRILPTVIEPGCAIGTLSEDISSQYGIPSTCSIVAGTTDSIAAFLASGATEPGEAVTSLGSTIAIKALSLVPVQDASRGIYSHRLGDQWLVGGASNVGCAIFTSLGISEEELITLSKQIDESSQSAFASVYYPLIKRGERFPINDPLKEPILEPKPYLPDSNIVDRKSFLHGLFSAMARIEGEGYAALSELGATEVTSIFTAGGGSKNPTWTQIRANSLGKRVSKAKNTDAAFGCALLGAKYALKVV